MNAIFTVQNEEGEKFYHRSIYTRVNGLHRVDLLTPPAQATGLCIFLFDLICLQFGFDPAESGKESQVAGAGGVWRLTRAAKTLQGDTGKHPRRLPGG